MTVTTVLDLDEDRVVLLDGDRLEAQPLPRSFGDLALAGRVTLVQFPDGPDPARVEAVRRLAGGAARIHACRRLAAAAAAIADRHGIGGALLTCDAGWTALRAGLAWVDGSRVHVRRTLDLPELGGHAFASSLAAGLREDARAGLPGALTGNGARLAAITEEAAADPLYRDVPVVHVEGNAITAGELLDAVAIYQDRLTRRLGELGFADGVLTALTGAFADFVLLPGLIAAATGREPLVLPDAVAHGAALLADGRYCEPAPEPIHVTVPLHRTSGGRFEEVLVTVPPDGGSFATLGGRRLVLGRGVDSRCDLALALGTALPVEIDGAARELDLSVLPPGRYQVGLRVLQQGAHALMFTTPDGADTLFVPLTEGTPHL